MTNNQLDNAWEGRGLPNSAVAPGWIDGKGKDSDFMTIPFDGQSEKIWERAVGSKEWREVTHHPIRANHPNP
jgi:hypothetical protein